MNLFLRGIVPLVRFKSVIVQYDRSERHAGTSKYSLQKMLGLALDAVTSFSVVPLRLITLTGFVVFALSPVHCGGSYARTLPHMAAAGRSILCCRSQGLAPLT